MDPVGDAIAALSTITSSDLDNAGFDKLVQFQYWLMKHQGAVFVKTVGRLMPTK